MALLREVFLSASKHLFVELYNSNGRRQVVTRYGAEAAHGRSRSLSAPSDEPGHVTAASDIVKRGSQKANSTHSFRQVQGQFISREITQKKTAVESPLMYLEDNQVYI